MIQNLDYADSMPRPDRALPDGYIALRTLAEGPSSAVLHARGPGGEVVLRLAARGADAAELATLAALDHPGLARLEDYGQLESTREAWVARSFVPGEELGRWAQGRRPEAIGAVVAELLPALQHLHERGFLHGDLKPANIIVDAQGRPHLTDFGLSRRDGARQSGGSLFYVAPEALAGGATTAASDLFAVGVLLHALLLRATVTATEFYALFPRHDVFTATGTRVEDLPTWARSLVERLLDRDPARRPASAAQVERELRDRLGLAPPAQSEDLRRRRLRWSALGATEDWDPEDLLDEPRDRVVTLPAGDDPTEVAEALRLRFALAGRNATLATPRAIGVRGGDLAALSAHALEVCGDGVLLVPLRPERHEDQQRFTFLARAAQQLRDRGASPAPAAVLGLSAGDVPRTLERWPNSAAPRLERATLRAWIDRDLGPGLEDFADTLERVSGGSARVAREQLQARLRRGDLVLGADGVELRPGATADDWSTEADAERRVAELSDSELRLLVALHLCRGRATTEELRTLLSVAPEDLAADVAHLGLSGELALEEGEHGARRAVATRRPAQALQQSIEASDLRDLHRRLADGLESRGAATPRLHLHRFAASPGPAERTALEEQLERLEALGRSEEQLTLAEELLAIAERLAPGSAPWARTEVARAWTSLGRLELAEAALEGLGEGLTAHDEGALQRALGRIAYERRDLPEASRRFAAARRSDPEDGGNALALEAHLRFEERDDDALDACLAEAAATDGALTPRYRFNLETLRALTEQRRGRFDAAREGLERLVGAARREGDLEREAKARLNLALLLRTGGAVEHAAEQLERVVQVEEVRGHLPGLAQARAMLGSVRRSQGQLEDAAALLRSARELRERLGDATGATASRGMLGLVQADRGLLRDARDELEASATALRKVGRSTDALVLEARARELLARLEPSPPRGAKREDPPADPRILLGWARAAALWGEASVAVEYVERSLSLARRLEHRAAVEEATFLLAALQGEALDSTGPGATPRLAAEVALARRLHLAPDELDGEADLDHARELLAAGHLDLAARLAVHVVAVAESPELRSAALTLASGALTEVERGLTPEQSARARRTLLGRPDPRLDEVEAFEEARASGSGYDHDLLTLLDINKRLVTQEDQGALLGSLVESALTVARAERGFLILEIDGELEFDVARHSRRGALDDPELEVSSSILRRAFEAGATLRLSNASADPLLANSPSVEALELRSILVTPFQVDERVRGVIYVDHRIRVGAFSERAEQLLELLASQAALAIRQVRRIEEIRGLNAELERRVSDREAELRDAQRALVDAGADLPVGELVGSSPAMRDVRATLRRCAPAALPVLVSGASGTGKELAARALHRLSPRREGPLIAENCAALPASLIESELFGYKKGAFTGADRDRAGIFERANGGTLFLDEIGELPIELQAKLLRVLETGDVRRIGDTRVLHTDFRLVAATNRDLHREVGEGRFRADLMYRLDALRVDLPTLAERVEDVPELVEHFLGLEAARGGPRRRATRSVLSALSRRAWPGNVRELSNEVARLCVLSSADLDDPGLVRAARAEFGPTMGSTEIVPIAELERRAILAALERTGGDKREAAEQLGISRAKLYQRLKQWSEDGER